MIFSTRSSFGDLERPDDDAGVGRLEDDPGALDVHVWASPTSLRGTAVRPWTAAGYRAWRNAARELSSRFISASERRKARVDSAPWFRFTRSSCRPSQHPPVRRVVQLLAQVVAAEEPLERGPGLVHPGGVLGDPVRLQAGGDRRAGLDRLLVEPGPLAAPCGRTRCCRSPGSAPAGPSGP